MMFAPTEARAAQIAAFLFCLLAVGAMGAPKAPGHWWPPAVEKALAQAGKNRAELRAALQHVPPAQREGLQFLLENMPPDDLQTLSAPFLLQNTTLAYDALGGAPWQKHIPKSVFLNDVLPYSCLNEARDGSRATLRAQSLPLVAGCRTPSEAAQRLNEKLFPLLHVRYSTERRRPDQAPLETIASGKATCSGLSILLADACRSVGVPARVAGTPLWANGTGNHTWVEVWDGGWHFVGAAEPDAKGLDHAWFTDNAAQAKRDVPEHAIYASSFQKTGLAFPLVWAPGLQWVPAVNVTERYAPNVAAAPTDKARLLIRVIGPNGRRVAAQITVRDIADAAVHFAGESRGETADINDLPAFDVPRDREYEIVATSGKMTLRRPYHAGAGAPDVVTLTLESLPPAKPISPVMLARLKGALADYFAAPADRQAHWAFPANLGALLRQNEPGVRQVAWEAYRAAPVHGAMRAGFDKNQVQFEKNLSPYTIKTVGTRPANGWPLFIAMHGGGSGPKELNDSQWRGMQVYYKDHPEVGGYQYLALRAPNDTWNGFYDDYVYPLVANLIRQFTLFGDVDPNKVFLMGYSHGGYGAFAIGPKEPDLFAAIHGSAAAPTDGETAGRTLRSTIFTGMVGGEDTMYGRLDRDRKFDAEIRALRGDRNDIYPVTIEVKEGVQHSYLQDRDKIPDMYPAVRNPVPREVSWLMTDAVIKDFFWLRTDAPGKTQEIDATCRNNHVVVTTTPSVTSATVLLDSRLMDFTKPLTLEVNGIKSERRLVPSLRTLCETLGRRGDPDLAFTAQVALALPGVKR